MGTDEKLIRRFLKQPKDFTFDEMERLLALFGYLPYNKGKTSGSRIIFKKDSNRPSCFTNRIRTKSSKAMR